MNSILQNLGSAKVEAIYFSTFQLSTLKIVGIGNRDLPMDVNQS